jgi:hypothetical protein
MRSLLRRRSRARPRPPTRPTTPTSWLNRWEALQDQHEAELARIAEAAADVRPNGPQDAQAFNDRA